MIGYELTRWWSYRQIRHSHMGYYVWGVPLFLTAAVMLIYVILPVKPHLRGDDGVLKGALQVLALLPGFFISALAAVATFGRDEMDESMSDPAPTIIIQHMGKSVSIELTRRIFLTYLFSYLSILSILLTAAFVVSPYVAQNIELIKFVHINGLSLVYIFYTIKYFGLIFIVYFLSSLFVTMLHGIYFLCEKIHMPIFK